MENKCQHKFSFASFLLFNEANWRWSLSDDQFWEMDEEWREYNELEGRKANEFTFQRNLKPIGEWVGEAREKDDRRGVRMNTKKAL